jgi:hypothetical protein
MKRTIIALVSTVAFVLASAATLPAQGKRGSAPKPQHALAKSTTTKGASPRMTQAGPKTSGPRKTNIPQTSKGPKNTTVKATGKTKTTSPSPKPAKADVKPAKTEKTGHTTTATSTSNGTPALTTVQERLQKNTKLADRLEGRLPSGTNLIGAAEGFKNLGQFVAAVNVSQNLGLDFQKLKTAMVTDGKSLGQAIQFVRPDVENPTLVAQRAESEASTLIQQTEKNTTTTTTSNTKAKDKPKRTRNGSGS